MTTFLRLRLVSLCVFLLAASSVVSAVDWKSYTEQYGQRVHGVDLREFDSRHVSTSAGSKPVPAILRKNRPVVDVNGTTIPDYGEVYEFDQLIDHTDPSRGTFKMRFFHTWEFYKPGGPIILYTPGEQALDSPGGEFILTNLTMPGYIAQSTNGAVIAIEHRFYGKSNPTPDLSVENLKLHTISQALDDFVYFAENVKLPMPGGNTEAIRPHKTPWIIMGGSYPGALAVWMLEQRPGVFWASYSSSGVVQPQTNFWQYWTPVEKYLQANCSADIRAVIAHIDGVIDAGDQGRLDEIKTRFGLQDLNTVSFLNALVIPLRAWQTRNVHIEPSDVLAGVCGFLETRGDEIAPPTGWGVDIALENWATLYSDRDEGFVATLCNGTSTETIQNCSTLHYNGLSLSPVGHNDARPWLWTSCYETGWFQTGNPSGGGIVSKYYNVQAMADICRNAFAGAFTNSVPEWQARVDKITEQYKGWNTTAERVLVVNGRRDPWLELTLSATALNIASTSQRPIYLTDGYHCSDLKRTSAETDPSIAQVWTQARITFQRWVSEFKPTEKPASAIADRSQKNSATGTVPRFKGGSGLMVLAGVFGVGALI